MPSDPVTLDDLRVVYEYPTGPHDRHEHRTRRATLDDLIEVLEGMGAERDATAFRQLGTEGLFGWRVEVDGPGSYLVLPLPTPQEEG